MSLYSYSRIISQLIQSLIQNKATSTNDFEEETAGQDVEETQELFSQPQDLDQTPPPSCDVESGSSTSLEMDYEEDPDVPEGVIPQSQPCYRRGIHYTPLGLKRVYRAKPKKEETCRRLRHSVCRK